MGGADLADAAAEWFAFSSRPIDRFNAYGHVRLLERMRRLGYQTFYESAVFWGAVDSPDRVIGVVQNVLAALPRARLPAPSLAVGEDRDVVPVHRALYEVRALREDLRETPGVGGSRRLSWNSNHSALKHIIPNSLGTSRTPPMSSGLKDLRGSKKSSRALALVNNNLI